MMEPMIPWPIPGGIYTASEFENVFFKCIKDGNIDWLDSAKTDIRMNLNTRNDKGETPLLFAIRNAPDDKKLQIVKMLLSTLHVLVDFDDKNGNTPLHEAMLQDNSEITLKLLYKHADISQKNSDGASPLDILSTNNCPKIKAMLNNNPPEWLTHGGDYQQLYTLRKSAEHSSDINYEPISNSNDKNSREYREFIAAYKTACNGKKEANIVKLLQRTNIDIHTNHEFPLRWAAKNGHTKTVAYLLTKGADIHAWNDEALFWALGKGHEQTTLELLKNGADIHARGEKGLIKVFNQPHTVHVNVHPMEALDKFEQEKYPFSSNLKPSLSEKYFYHTKVKSAIKSKDRASLISSLFTACKKDHTWIVHQILKQKILSKTAIKSAFTVAACKGYYNRKPKVVHVLLEHGLNAQESTEKFYIQWNAATFVQQHGEKAKNLANDVMDILKQFGGDPNLAGKKQLQTIKSIIKHSKGSLPFPRRFPY